MKHRHQRDYIMIMDYAYSLWMILQTALGHGSTDAFIWWRMSTSEYRYQTDYYLTNIIALKTTGIFQIDPTVFWKTPLHGCCSSSSNLQKLLNRIQIWNGPHNLKMRRHGQLQTKSASASLQNFYDERLNTVCNGKSGDKSVNLLSIVHKYRCIQNSIGERSMPRHDNPTTGALKPAAYCPTAVRQLESK